MEEAVGRDDGEEQKEEQVGGIREGRLRQVRGERDVTEVMGEQQQVRKAAQDMLGLGGEERRQTGECLWSAERAFTYRRHFSRLSLSVFFKIKEKK